MGWVKLDDGFPMHPKVVGLTFEARWAYIESLCYAARYETDGVVPDVVAANGPVRAELMASGLWESGTAAVRIHDFLIYNPSRLERERKRNVSRTLRSSREGDGIGSGDLLSEGEFEREPFAEFWSVVPRKVGKPKARYAFEQALRRASAAEITEGMRRYRDDPNRDDAYTAHPTTWLNRDGWLDDALPSRRPNGPEIAIDRRMRRVMEGVNDANGPGGDMRRQAAGELPRVAGR